MSEFEDVLCKFLLQQPSLDALLWHRLRTVNRRFSKVDKASTSHQVGSEGLAGLSIRAGDPC